MIIYIKVLNGEECHVEVSPNESIGTIKNLLSDLLKIPVNNQKLVFKGKTLSDINCLKDYNIGPNTRMHLILSKPLLINNKSSTTATIDKSKKSSNSNYDFWNILHKHIEQTINKNDSEILIDVCKKNFNTEFDRFNLNTLDRIAKSQMESKLQPLPDDDLNNELL
ncbi:unnamed protein product [Gordionus sp. m RMFG-2023]|uniref:ubiquitin-like protein 4A n=1 Tax=Gordionus sp. m RMFG-2023 TaxID=3053472 RepID=UPI0030DE25E9